ncbi:MIP/aquaporin family protein [Streptomyces sp. NPDC059861]|uniref:MIP/aquaporin family protein n=1 Tax=Streptomyces sp. NPDC059861 TaxID=3346974 RepID=UPI00364BD70E
MNVAFSLPRRPLLARAVDEFVLATVLLFLAVTVVRWVREPDSALYVGDLGAALAVIGVLSGAILTGLILSPPGRRSGGHMNPAVTVSLWLMDAFPGRSVAPYVLAQLAGSAAGTGLGRLVWGPAVSLPSVDYAVIVPAPTWQPMSVFATEAGSMTIIMVAVGLTKVHARSARFVPYVIGPAVALVIAVLGPRSGGSANPARQFGPAHGAGHGPVDLPGRTGPGSGCRRVAAPPPRQVAAARTRDEGAQAVATCRRGHRRHRGPTPRDTHPGPDGHAARLTAPERRPSENDRLTIR